MFSIRARTLSGLSSFLDCSLALSGSRYPSAHCPSPRLGRVRPERPGPVEPGPAAGLPLFEASLGGVTGMRSWVERRTKRYVTVDIVVGEVRRRPHAPAGSGAPYT